MSQQDLNTNKELFGHVTSNEAAEINNDYTLNLDQKAYYFQNPKAYSEYRKKIPYQVGLNDRVERFKQFMSDPATFALFKDGAEDLKNLNKEIEQIELDNSSVFNKFAYSFNKNRISQNAMDAYADWADAKHNKQFLKAQEAYKEYERLQAELDEKYSADIGEKGGGAFSPLRYAFLSTAEIAASQANWQSAAAIAGGVATGVFTGGLGTVASGLASGAVSTGISWNRTRDVEMGSALNDMLNSNPNADFDKAYSLAVKAGNINAAIESAGYFFGAGKTATKGVKKLINPFLKATGDNAVKQAMKSPAFTKMIFGAAKDFVLDPLSEGIQETLQDKVQLMAQDYLANNKEDVSYYNMLADATERDIKGFKNILLSDNLSEEDKQQLETFVSTMAGTLGMAGASSGLSMTSRRVARAISENASAKRDLKANDNIVILADHIKNKLPNLNKEQINTAIADQLKDTVITVPKEIFKSLDANMDKFDDETKALINNLKETSKELPDGKLSVDKYTYADIVANSKELFQTIREDVRFTTDGLTIQEGKDIIKNLIKESEVFQREEGAKEIFDDMTRVLEKSAGYDNTQAKLNSFMYVQIASSLANAEGVSLREAVENLRLSIVDEREKINNQDLNQYKKVQKKLFSEKLEGQKVSRENIDLKNVQLAEGFNMESVIGQQFTPELVEGIMLFRTKDGQLLSLEGNKKIAIAKMSPEAAITKAIIFDEKNTSLEKAKEVVQKIKADRRKAKAMKAAGIELERMRASTKKPKKTFKSLSEFVSSKQVGGIKDVDGWLARGIDKKGNKIVNNTSGISYVDAMEKAYDAGYFPHISDIRQEMTDADFIDAVLNDYNAEEADKTYSERDIEKVDEYFKEISNLSANDQLWNEAGLDPILDTTETAYEKLRQVDGWEDIVTGEMENAPEELYQKIIGEQKAGVTKKTDEGFTLKFLEATNPTTFMHEMNHVFSMKMIDLYNDNRLSSYWKETLENAIKWAGGKVQDGKIILGRDGYEKLAEGFTKYFKTGKAPISTLNRLFAYFANLFEKVYKMLRMDNSIRLNKNVTDYYDKMILTRDQIRQRDLEDRVIIFEKPEGVSTQDWNDLLAQSEELIAVRQTKFEKAVENRMKFYKDIRYKNQKEKITKEAMAELLEEPVYQIQEEILARKIDPETIPEGVNIPPAYLSKDGGNYQEILSEIASAQGNEYAAQLPQVLSSPNLETTLKKKVALRMKDWMDELPQFSDTNFDKLTKDYEAFKYLVHRFCVLTGIKNKGEYAASLAKEAQEMINQMPLSEMANYEKQVKILNNLSLQTIGANKNTMADITRRMATQMYAVIESQKIRDEVNTFSDRYKNYLRDYNPTKNKNIDGEAWDIMNAFLYNNKYTQKQPKSNVDLYNRVNEYLSNLDVGYSVSEQLRYMDVLKNATAEKRDKFMQMRYDNFVDLKNVMDIVEEAAKYNNKIVTEQEKADVQDVANQIVNHIVNVRKMRPDDKIKETMLNNRIMSTTMKNWLPDAVYDKIFLPLVNAVSQKDVLIHKMNDEIYNILKDKQDLFKSKYNIVSDNNVYSLNGEEILSIILNCGNRQNEQIIMHSLSEKGIIISDINKFLAQMPKDALELANSVWGWFDKRKQLLADKAAELNNGKVLKLVTAEQKKITLPNGEEFTLNGGYFPLVRKDIGIDNYSEKGKPVDVNAFPLVSIFKDRLDPDDLAEIESLYEIKTDLKPLFGYINKASSSLTIAQAYNNFLKIMNNKDVQRALGDTRVRYVQDWLNSLVISDKADKFLTTMNSMASFSVLGGKMSSAIVQILGSTIGFATIGPIYMTKSLMHLLANPQEIIHPAKSLSEKSLGMQSRYIDFEKSIQDIVEGKSEAQKNLKGVSRGFAQAFMMFQTYGDAVASNIIWEAEYKKQLDLGKDETIARMRADDAVRSTQGDASTVSRVSLTRGANRFSSRFMSYFFAMYSNVMAAMENPNKIEALKKTSAIIAAIMVAAAGEAYIKSSLNGDDEDKTKDEIFRNMAENVGNTFVPFLGIGGIVAGSATGHKNYSAELISSWIGSIGNVPYKVSQGEYGEAISSAVSAVSRNWGKHVNNILNKGVSIEDELLPKFLTR